MNQKSGYESLLTRRSTVTTFCPTYFSYWYYTTIYLTSYPPFFKFLGLAALPAHLFVVFLAVTGECGLSALTLYLFQELLYFWVLFSHSFSCSNWSRMVSMHLFHSQGMCLCRGILSIISRFSWLMRSSSESSVGLVNGFCLVELLTRFSNFCRHSSRLIGTLGLVGIVTP